MTNNVDDDKLSAFTLDRTTGRLSDRETKKRSGRFIGPRSLPLEVRSARVSTLCEQCAYCEGGIVHKKDTRNPEVDCQAGAERSPVLESLNGYAERVYARKHTCDSFYPKTELEQQKAQLRAKYGITV